MQNDSEIYVRSVSCLTPSSLALLQTNVRTACTVLYRGADKSLRDQEGNKLQRQKILSFIYPIYNHNWRNISATRVGTLIVATIYLQLIQNRYMFRSFTVLHCSHQHCAQSVASDVEVVGYL